MSKEIDLDMLVETTGASIETVKAFLFTLVMTGHIRAKFTPVCCVCHKAYTSAYVSHGEARYDMGEEPLRFCNACQAHVGYEMIMSFYRMGDSSE